jgi:hypothetical protein
MGQGSACSELETFAKDLSYNKIMLSLKLNLRELIISRLTIHPRPHQREK